MKLLQIIIIILFSGTIAFAQSNVEKDINKAFTNAKKGMYYALSNIPENKTRLSSDLVEKNHLLAKIRLSKEVNGIKIQSTGYNSSNEVTIVIYKSFTSLVKEGYIKKDEIKRKNN